MLAPFMCQQLVPPLPDFRCQLAPVGFVGIGQGLPFRRWQILLVRSGGRTANTIADTGKHS